MAPSSTDRRAGVSAEQLLTLRAKLYASQIELLNSPRGEQHQLRKAVGEMDRHFFNLHAAFRSQQQVDASGLKEAQVVVTSKTAKKKKIKITGGVKQSVKVVNIAETDQPKVELDDELVQLGLTLVDLGSITSPEYTMQTIEKQLNARVVEAASQHVLAKENTNSLEAVEAAFEAATAVLEDACEFEATPAKPAPKKEAAESEEFATPTKFFGRRSSITNIDQTPGSSAKKDKWNQKNATREKQKKKKKKKNTGRVAVAV